PDVSLSEAEVSGLVPFDAGMSRLVFIDGHYLPEASRIVDADNASILRLAEAVREEESLVHGHLGRYSEPGHDASVGLHTAFFRDGAYIHADGRLTAPVHIVYITGDHGEPVVTYPRTLVVAGKDAEVTLIESFVSLGSRNHFTEPVTELALGEGSSVTHYRLLLENTDS